MDLEQQFALPWRDSLARLSFNLVFVAKLPYYPSVSLFTLLPFSLASLQICCKIGQWTARSAAYLQRVIWSILLFLILTVHKISIRSWPSISDLQKICSAENPIPFHLCSLPASSISVIVLLMLTWFCAKTWISIHNDNFNYKIIKKYKISSY